MRFLPMTDEIEEKLYGVKYSETIIDCGEDVNQIPENKSRHQNLPSRHCCPLAQMRAAVCMFSWRAYQPVAVRAGQLCLDNAHL